jgi:hypothetical protein
VSRARAWVLANALNGLGDPVSTGELDAQSALEQFGIFAARERRRGTATARLRIDHAARLT